MKRKEFSIRFSKDNIYQSIDCYPANPVFEQVEEEYQSMQQTAYDRIQPEAYLVFGSVPDCAATQEVAAGTEVLYVITTLGRAVSEWSTALFAEGNYLAGLLADAMADDYLFQMESELEDTIVSLCKEAGYGITRNLEAPTGIGIQIQRAALEAVQAQEETDLTITGSYMYEPIKTTCHVYVLEKGLTQYHTKHNCRECPAVDCKRRRVLPVTVMVENEAGGSRELSCKEGQTILELLAHNAIYISAVCAGRGTCGKCRVRVLEGIVPVSEEDKRLLTEQEIKEGIRLACGAYPKSDCRIRVKMQEDAFCIVSDYAGHTPVQKPETKEGPKWSVGIDIGTTTIAMQLVDRTSGKVADTYTAINRQRIYGADVVSRMQASNQGKKEELQQCVVSDLQKGLQELLQRNDLSERAIAGIGIAGNTTMLHLLLGYSCETLGVYPFEPVSIDSLKTDWAALTDAGCDKKVSVSAKREKIPVWILPGISTYVGADITAGLLACGMDHAEETVLLLDLGTNGEMAIGNRERIITASAAAGPAFEAGNISCGVGSIPGAICHVTIQKAKTELTTIGGEVPCGICGTGVIETVYELWKEGLLDETGLLEEEYFETGFVLGRDRENRQIVFTQKDVRELQLAKAAVRAGLETLMEYAGVSEKEIRKIYVAGGFGYQMDFTKAIGIGLLPSGFAGRITAIGNSALKGAIDCLVQENAEKRLEELVRKAEEITLADSVVFRDKYMEHMYFGKP